MRNFNFDFILNSPCSINELGIMQFDTNHSNYSISYDDHGHDNCFAIEDNSFWFNYRNEIIKSLIKNHLNKGATFFDVGGGNGYVSKAIQELGYQSILVEPKYAGSFNAVNRGVKNVINGFFNSENFRKNSIENIGLFDVIEHIEHDLEFLNEVNLLLAPKGKVFVTVPAYNLLWSEHDIQAGHFRRYSKKSLKDVFNNSNFNILYCSCFFSFLTIPNFLFRSIPFLFGKNISKEKKNSLHKVNKPITKKAISHILNFELSFINNNRAIPLPGNSIIIIAEKKNG